MSDIDNNNAINISTYKEKDAVKDLMRSIEATYRIRINAAQRLRDKYNHDKMLHLYYST